MNIFPLAAELSDATMTAIVTYDTIPLSYVYSRGQRSLMPFSIYFQQLNAIEHFILHFMCVVMHLYQPLQLFLKHCKSYYRQCLFKTSVSSTLAFVGTAVMIGAIPTLGNGLLKRGQCT